MSTLRSFIHDVVAGSSDLREVPRDLFRIARSVLRGNAANDEDDLVGDLLVRLVQSAQRRLAYSETLLALDDRRLAGALRVRFAQLAAERIEGWDLVRQLRMHLKAGVTAGAPKPALPRPLSLFVDDRLCAQRIWSEAAWHQEHAPAFSRTIRDLSARIAAAHFPAMESLTESDEHATDRSRNPEESVHHAHDARKLTI